MYGLFDTIEEYNEANREATVILELGVTYAPETPNQDKNGMYYMYLRPELVNVMDCEIVESVEYEETEND